MSGETDWAPIAGATHMPCQHTHAQLLFERPLINSGLVAISPGELVTKCAQCFVRVELDKASNRLVALKGGAA